MQLSYILAAATALVSFVPGISANADAETGRGIRRHRNYRYGGYDQYYGRNNDYGYDNDNYGYDGENDYDYNRGHSRNYGGLGSYYRYRRNEDAVQQTNVAENAEQVKQSAVAEQADGHRYHRRHHDRQSGRRSYGNYYYDYDYDYGYGRRRSDRNRRNSYYYY